VRPRGFNFPLLVRDFVQEGLYGKGGYFSTAELIFKSEPLDFTGMLGETEYKRELAKLYRESDVGWTTPVEIFKPWYGRAIANYITSSAEDEDIVIYEIGGGRGRLLIDTVEYLRQHAPHRLSRLDYNIIDISTAMINDVKAKIEADMKGRVTLHNLSALEWKKREDRKCFVVALEVLSNFPSDKIVVTNNEVEEVHVEFSSDDGLIERRWPLRDNKLKYALDAASFVEYTKRGGGGGLSSLLSRVMGASAGAEGYIPTNIVQLFAILKSKFPNSKVIFPDFDRFQSPCTGYCAPVVQLKKGGKTQMFSSYLAAASKVCDVMFPLDFPAICEAYSNVTGKEGQVVTTEDFMLKYGELDNTMTLSGYNPLIDDYENTKFLLS